MPRIVRVIVLWATRIRHPFFVPKEGEAVLEVLRIEGASGFLTELDRRSQLGSAWASSLLAYIELSNATEEGLRTARARTLTTRHAERGDAYAQYVLAWALFIGGEHGSAIEYMTRSAVQGFPPALMDFALFAWLGVSESAPDPSTAMRLLASARRAKHSGEWLRRCGFYRSGKYGAAKRILGIALEPIAMCQYGAAVLWSPFSAKSVSFVPGRSGAVLQ